VVESLSADRARAESIAARVEQIRDR
jgi:hypothetical protein